MSRGVYASLLSVFDEIYHKNVTNNRNYPLDNMIATTWQVDTSYDLPKEVGEVAYTDDRSSAGLDVVAMYWEL